MSSSTRHQRRSRATARTPLACTACRQRKVKCDGKRPSCSSCLKRETTCHWPISIATDEVDITNAISSTSSQDYLIPPNPGYITKESVSSESILPSLDQLQPLFDIFFNHHLNVELCSFFHRPSLNISLLSKRSPFIVVSIVTLTALYVPDNQVQKDFGFGTSVEFSDHYAKCARNYASNSLGQPSINNIQAFLILGLREHIAQTKFQPWMYIGIAIRMAQALRLGSEFNQRYQPREREIRRRTYWACFTMDRLMSHTNARSTTISLETARVQLPCPDHVFAFEQMYSGPALSDLSSQIDDSTIASIGLRPYYIRMVQLWSEMSIISVYGGRRYLRHLPTDPRGEFFKANLSIQNYATTFPDKLLWSPLNCVLYQNMGQFQTYVNLHFLLNHAQCVMHHEYLPQVDAPSDQLAESDNNDLQIDQAGLSLHYYDDGLVVICFTAAENIALMARELWQGTTEERRALQSLFVAGAIMNAAAVHLWAHYTQWPGVDSRESKSKFNALLEITKSWIPQWQIAVAFSETLEMLDKLYDFSYNPGGDNYWEDNDDEDDRLLTEKPLLKDETKYEGGHSGLTEGDGAPNPAFIHQSLFDKVRMVLLLHLECRGYKKRALKRYIKTSWRNIWAWENLQVIGDLLDM